MWKLKVEIECPTYECVQAMVVKELKRITAAKSVKDIYACYAWGGGMGNGGSGSVSVSITSPVHERIKQLREEADKLEAEL